jgi:thiol:disulfide interchange protein DsbG
LNRRRFALAAPAALLAACTLAACQDKPAASAAASAGTAGASPAQAPAPDAYALAAKGTGFTVGPVMAAHTVYVFFDPACPHCAHLWNEAKPLATRLKMVWMPVQLLRNTSGPQGATILAAANPAEAMEQNEASVLARGPGIAVPASLPDGLLAKVKANTELFNQAGAESVPFIVFRNAQSGQVGTHAGAVSTAELAAMAGV